MASLLASENDDLTVSLPITTAAISRAENFARSQPDAAKSRAIRLNTLAVLVMNDYCQMMAIPTDLEHSDSWNPLIRTLSDVADLRLPNIGQLECRPVHPEATVCYIPPDVWDLRVGYVVIAIDEGNQTGHLLGFIPTVEAEEIHITQLQPLEDLFDHLFELQQATVRPPSAAISLTQDDRSIAIAHLGQWLNASFEAGWQAVEDLLFPDSLSPAISFRTRGEEGISMAAGVQSGAEIDLDVRRAKLIDLALQLGIQQVVMVVEMRVSPSQQTDIGIQVYPASGQPFLPPDLEVAVLEPADVVLMRVQSRQADNYIQLQLTGTSEERFKIRLTLEDAQYIEEFII